MGARLPDVELISQIKNYGVPVCDKRAAENLDGLKKAHNETLVSKMLINFRIRDLQDFIGRYKWYNLPEGITQELLERMFYYRGQVGFFYEPAEEKAYILPYVLNGTIDMYGRFTGVSFLPFNGRAETDKKNIYIPGEGRTVIHDVPLPEEVDINMFNNGCVLCTDYSKQYAQNIIPKVQTQEPLLQMEAEIYPLVRTALINNTGVKTIVVNSKAEADQVPLLNQSLYDAAINGDTNIGFIGNIKTQVLDNITATKPDDYLLTLQSLENMRLGFLGLQNGGIFQKKATELQSENDMISTNAQTAYNDGLRNRQNWCNIINAVWGINMWCGPSETEMMSDMNGDGLLTNSEDNDNTNEAEAASEGDENAELS